MSEVHYYLLCLKSCGFTYLTPPHDTLNVRSCLWLQRVSWGNGLMVCSARNGDFLHGAALMNQSLSGAKSRWEQAGARRESSVLMPDWVRPNHVLQRICPILGKICLYRQMLLLLCDWRVRILPPKCSTGTCLAFWLAMGKDAAKWNSELHKR